MAHILVGIYQKPKDENMRWTGHMSIRKNESKFEPTNKKAVFWNLDSFLCTDMTGYF